MQNRVAVIYTTFLRDNLAKKTLLSLFQHLDKSYYILVGDQNEEDRKKFKSFLGSFKGLNNPIFKYYKLDFDCGLSAARNRLVNEATKLGIKYCLISADSIAFTEKPNLLPIIEFLDEDPKKGLVGFELKNRVYWTCDMKLVEREYFNLDIPRRKPIKFQGIDFQPCDIVRNFFLAKTQTLMNVEWDEKLKLAEHEDWFYRFGKKYKIFFTDFIEATYIDDKPPKYLQSRRRIFDYKEALKKKYNLKKWVNYSPDLLKEFAKWRKSI